MALIRYNPNQNPFGLKSNMDRLFDDFFGLDKGIWPENTLKVVPAVDLKETEDHFLINAELPGMSKKEISISLENNVISISGEKKVENEEKDNNYHRVERSYGKFHRAFELPGAVNRDKIEADYTDGILSIIIPKTEEAKPKQIEIKVK